jgi:hypothetical protein
MMRFSKSLFAAALAAFLFALVGVADASGTQPAPGSATISNPGGRDFSGFMIVVEPSGRAWALDGAGHSNGQLQGPLTQMLFADLAAAGPLARLPDRDCDQALLIGWNGQRSSNLQCSADPRSIKLISDIAAIQRVLYVQSYRVAIIQGNTSNAYAAAPAQHVGGAYVPTGGYASSSSSQSPASNSNNGYFSSSFNVGGYVNAGAGSVSAAYPAGTAFSAGTFAGNFGSGLNLSGTGVGARFTNGTFDAGRFSDSGRMSRENGSFSTSHGSGFTVGNSGGLSSSGSFSNSGSDLQQNRGLSGGFNGISGSSLSH